MLQVGALQILPPAIERSFVQAFFGLRLLRRQQKARALGGQDIGQLAALGFGEVLQLFFFAGNLLLGLFIGLHYVFRRQRIFGDVAVIEDAQQRIVIGG